MDVLRFLLCIKPPLKEEGGPGRKAVEEFLHEIFFLISQKNPSVTCSDSSLQGSLICKDSNRNHSLSFFRKMLVISAEISYNKKVYTSIFRLRATKISIYPIVVPMPLSKVNT